MSIQFQNQCLFLVTSFTASRHSLSSSMPGSFFLFSRAASMSSHFSAVHSRRFFSFVCFRRHFICYLLLHEERLFLFLNLILKYSFQLFRLSLISIQSLTRLYTITHLQFL